MTHKEFKQELNRMKEQLLCDGDIFHDFIWEEENFDTLEKPERIAIAGIYSKLHALIEDLKRYEEWFV